MQILRNPLSYLLKLPNLPKLPNWYLRAITEVIQCNLRTHHLALLKCSTMHLQPAVHLQVHIANIIDY